MLEFFFLKASMQGVITVRFVDSNGGKCEKMAYLEDPIIAAFGTYTGGEPPPGVVAVPSSSRPGIAPLGLTSLGCWVFRCFAYFLLLADL